MFTSARIKLTLLLTGIVIALFLLTSATVYLFVSQMTIGRLDFRLRQDAAWLLQNPRAMQMALQGGRAPAFPGTSSSPVLRPLFLVIVRNPTGAIITTSNPGLASAIPLLSPTFQTTPTFATWRVRGTDEWFRVISIPLSGGGTAVAGIVQIAEFVGPEMDILMRLAQLVWLVGLGGTIVAIVAGYAVSGRVLRPIIRSWLQQQRFVGDASHELRTPLAVIQTNLDLVLCNADECSLQNLEWVSNAKAEVRRLTRLTSDLLTLARADSQEAVLEMECADLSGVVGEVVGTMSFLAEQKDITLTVDDGPAASGSDRTVFGDVNRLRQLVMILLDNAIKYTPEGGRIDVVLDRQSHAVSLRVKDTGIAMDRELMTHIFERFYRGDKVRERSEGGAGLGLSIAKWIVDMHRGRITVQSTKGEGSVFHVILPCPTAAQTAAVHRGGRILH